MNMKKILILLIFAIAIVGIIAPAEAKYTAGMNPISQKTSHLHVDSDIGMKSKNWNSAKYVSKRKAEVNKINKIVITIKGTKDKTIKKPAKGWKSKTITGAGFYKALTINNPDGKKYSIKFYNKKNKVIYTKKGELFYDDMGDENRY